MSPKRKIPSRKFSSQSKSKSAKPTKRTGPSKPVHEPPPAAKIASCFWDMGFETKPTIEELRQRYKELSLVLHPDAGGTKESFQALRTNYETAQALLTQANQK